MIAGVLLLVMEEYEAFWTMRAFITRLFPHDYYDKVRPMPCWGWGGGRCCSLVSCSLPRGP